MCNPEMPKLDDLTKKNLSPCITKFVWTIHLEVSYKLDITDKPQINFYLGSLKFKNDLVPLVVNRGPLCTNFFT